MMKVWGVLRFVLLLFRFMKMDDLCVLKRRKYRTRWRNESRDDKGLIRFVNRRFHFEEGTYAS